MRSTLRTEVGKVTTQLRGKIPGTRGWLFQGEEKSGVRKGGIHSTGWRGVTEGESTRTSGGRPRKQRAKKAPAAQRGKKTTGKGERG